MHSVSPEMGMAVSPPELPQSGSFSRAVLRAKDSKGMKCFLFALLYVVCPCSAVSHNLFPPAGLVIDD